MSKASLYCTKKRSNWTFCFLLIGPFDLLKKEKTPGCKFDEGKPSVITWTAFAAKILCTNPMIKKDLQFNYYFFLRSLFVDKNRAGPAGLICSSAS